jgi:hypothetical protein
MEKKKIENVKLDLFNRNSLFIHLAAWEYDISDKDRFRKLNQLVDKFSNPMPSDEIIQELDKYVPENFRWRNRTIELFETYKAMYLGPLTKTQRKKNIQFNKASLKLYYKIDEVLNRMDVLNCAFILRMSEYDIYLERMTEDLANPQFKTVKKIKSYIINNIVRGNFIELEDFGYWGNFSNVQYIPTLIISDDENKTIRVENDSLFTDKKRKGRGPKRVKLKDRIDWGAVKIHKLISDYRNKYDSFY